MPVPRGHVVGANVDAYRSTSGSTAAKAMKYTLNMNPQKWRKNSNGLPTIGHGAQAF